MNQSLRPNIIVIDSILLSRFGACVEFPYNLGNMNRMQDKHEQTDMPADCGSIGRGQSAPGGVRGLRSS